MHGVLNPYFAELVAALDEHLTGRHLTVLLGNHGDDFQRQRHFLELMLQYRADGLILCPSVGTTPGDLGRIVKAGLPTVLIARDVPGSDVTPVVRGDDRTGIRLATAHLVTQGHRRIAFVGGRVQSAAGRERRGGYEEALEAAGLPVEPELMFPDVTTRRGGREVVDLVLKARPTAIVAFNDLVAFGLMSALQERGIRPGREIALIGYDDIGEAADWSPALSSVWNGQQEVGRIAADMLASLIAGERPPERVHLVTPVLNVRETSAAPV